MRGDTCVPVPRALRPPLASLRGDAAVAHPGPRWNPCDAIQRLHACRSRPCRRAVMPLRAGIADDDRFTVELEFVQCLANPMYINCGWSAGRARKQAPTVRTVCGRHATPRHGVMAPSPLDPTPPGPGPFHPWSPHVPCVSHRPAAPPCSSSAGLSQQKTLQDPAFVQYLDYLRYWKHPQYAKYIMWVQRCAARGLALAGPQGSIAGAGVVGCRRVRQGCWSAWAVVVMALHHMNSAFGPKVAAPKCMSPLCPGSGMCLTGPQAADSP